MTTTPYHPSWHHFLQSEFQKPYFQDLAHFLHQAYSNKTIFPEKSQVFRAFSTDFNTIRVVIIGQDPYHTPGMAHGLAFSVPEHNPIPPSLRNIFQEIHAEFGTPLPPHGDLHRWASQGVLLLNNVLTVESGHAGSHRGRGWEEFTKSTVSHLSSHRPHLAFLLWGQDARSKAPLIDTKKHLILQSAHPSPLSAHRGFFGCNHFHSANQFLISHSQPPILW